MIYELEAEKNKITSLTAIIEEVEIEKDQIYSQFIKKDGLIAELELKVTMLTQQILERDKIS